MTQIVALLDRLRAGARAPLLAESSFQREELFRRDESGVGNGWLASSIELKRGLDVSEQPMDTLPGELVDEFFRH